MRLIQRAMPLLALLLAACPEKVPIDIGRAELMPESVARQVVERRLGRAWLQRPYLDLLNCFRGNVEYVSLAEIRSAWYVAHERSYWLGNYTEMGINCNDSSLRLTNVSEEEARELTAALVSLGAGIRPAR
jgi:hypothetical protein